MISSRLRRALAAAVLMAAAPASHAWTRISCELGGTVTNLPVQMRQYRIDGTEITQLMFKLKVRSADIPEGARADTDCREFVDRELDVVLDGAGTGAVRKGMPVKMRYRYDDSLGQAQATHFELER
ncbi:MULTISPECIES: hypothetical protein [Achromobacter]|jgi:hypothetical protein|uniref:Uncharacterized protein n=1 Tax=Achromobacter denitrificans TaxID=32002 RepID=A0A427WQB4_ACHDE|nr:MULTISPECIES: hypothetical protein [Achromobacter]ASC66078.1 hypothetical protein B9P52_18095 [Achromobacter denitrificans]QKQ45868.1 hypothetical protein FOC81_03805 [Achromobacter denitrificans]RSE82382.1 hypothetical protein EGU64_18015 [Achromobacter denitrificans]CAB3877254.1 hypothetical protein LMG1860_04145 [Achromobacter denitrificans]GFN29347.1 hypothetical protein ADE_50450 [Achromobacter denitrificans]